MLTAALDWETAAHSKALESAEQEERRAVLNEALGLLQERTCRAEFSIRRRNDDRPSRLQTCALYFRRHARRTSTAAKMSAHRASAVHNRYRQNRLRGPSLTLPVQ